MTAIHRQVLLSALLVSCLPLIAADCDPPACGDGSDGTLYLLDNNPNRTPKSVIYKLNLQTEPNRANLVHIADVPASVGGGGHLAVTPDKRYIWVIQNFTHELDIYDTITGLWTDVGEITGVGLDPNADVTQAVIDADGFFYFAQHDNGVFLVDPANPTVAALWASAPETEGGDLAWTLAAPPDGYDFFQVNRQGQTHSRLYRVQPPSTATPVGTSLPELATGLATYSWDGDGFHQRLVASFGEPVPDPAPGQEISFLGQLDHRVGSSEDPLEASFDFYLAGARFAHYEGDLATPTCF